MISILIIAGTFALCFCVDKLFTKLFRSRSQHRSGLSVRLNKRYASFGLAFSVIGVAAIITGLNDSLILLLGGCVVFAIGVGLVVYYLTFGIFYDSDSFVLTTFGKKSVVYNFRDIRAQQLYMIQGGGVVVELHLQDGRAVQIQSAMEGAYPFLDHAYSAWLRQTGRDPATCDFYDPANSCWFPPVEV